MPSTPTPTSTNPVTLNIDVISGLTLIILVVIGLIVLVFLYRSGWRWSEIKRMKLGGVEVERDIPEAAPSPNSERPTWASTEIEKSTFKGNVGDIGGVIIKGQNPNLEVANDSKATVTIQRSGFDGDVGDIGGKIVKDDTSNITKTDDEP